MLRLLWLLLLSFFLLGSSFLDPLLLGSLFRRCCRWWSLLIYVSLPEIPLVLGAGIRRMLVVLVDLGLAFGLRLGLLRRCRLLGLVSLLPLLLLHPLLLFYLEGAIALATLLAAHW